MLIDTPSRTLDRPATVVDRLTDGRTVVVRPQRTADGEALTAFFEALSPDSRRLRFLQPVPIIRPRLVQQLIDVDQVGHVAWIAATAGRIVGEARYVRLRDDPTAAEVAFAVAEDFRRVGLGRRLVETLGVIARCEGITTFTSSVSEENWGSTALLRELGTSFRFDSGALEGRGPVPAWTRSLAHARAIREHHLQTTSGVMRAAA